MCVCVCVCVCGETDRQTDREGRTENVQMTRLTR